MRVWAQSDLVCTFKNWPCGAAPVSLISPHSCSQSWTLWVFDFMQAPTVGYVGPGIKTQMHHGCVTPQTGDLSIWLTPQGFGFGFSVIWCPSPNRQSCGFAFRPPASLRRRPSCTTSHGSKSALWKPLAKNGASPSNLLGMCHFVGPVGF